MITKRNMTATMIALTMSMAMTATVLNGCSDTPKETTPETAKEQKTEAQTADTTGESGRDKESSTKAASGSYEDKTIGLVGMTLNDEYHTTLTNGTEVEAEAKGVRIEVQAGDQHASADAQLGIIENMIANKVDGILLVLNFSDGLEPTLIKYKEVGIPIIDPDTKLADESPADVGLDILFYGTSNCEGAKLAGEYVAKNLGKGTKTAIPKGIKRQTNAANRCNGLIEGAGDMVTVVVEQTVNWEVDQGYTTVRSITSVNPDAELFLYCSDNMGIGALKAVKGANMQEQIQIIGFNAVSGVLNPVKNGEPLAAVAQYPAEMGKLGVGGMFKIFDGGEAESYIDAGTGVIIKDNVGGLRDYLKIFE